MNKKSVCLTGITGQTSSYLAELYLEKGYKVYGLIRRSSTFSTERIDHIYNNPDLELIYGDLSDSLSINNFVNKAKPDIFINAGAQSHVKVSFEIPEYTFDIDSTGVIRCLEAIRLHTPKTKFLQCSTSVSGDTKVLIKLNDEIKLLPISDLSNDNLEKTNYNNLQCLTITDDYDVKWSNVAYVFSHESSNLYQLRGSGGLDIKITGDHSVIIMNNDGKLIEKKVEELKNDDFLISFCNKNNLNVNNIYPTFDLLEFGNKKQYLSRSTPQINELKINKDILRLIGFYVAEGSLYISDKHNSITWTFHIKETYYTEDIKNILKENFGITNMSEEEIPERNTRKLKLCSKQLVYFLKNNFDHGSYNKKIPSWMYSIPKEGFIEFLRGYIGDARILKNELIYTSCNKNLIENICYLCKLNGIDACISVRFNEAHLSPQKTIIKSSYAYDLKLRGEDCDLIQNKHVDRTKFKNLNKNLIDAKVYRNLITSKDLTKDNKKKSISKTRALNSISKNNVLTKICNSDLHIVRIKSIKKLDVKEMVYDLHVPETQRFIGGNHPILLHNSELFGSTPPPQNEKSEFHPRSPYACAKIAAYWATINYREAYNIFACNSISFNHESERRGETFITRKITRAATRIKLGLQNRLVVGDCSSMRDWSHAQDVSKCIMMILDYDKPDDYVIGSEEMHSVQEFIEIVFKKLDLDWKQYVVIDQKYYRPSEVSALCADASKVKNTLGWKPVYTFETLIDVMIENDLKIAQNEKTLLDIK